MASVYKDDRPTPISTVFRALWILLFSQKYDYLSRDFHTLS